jgi:hypothetical protein
MGKQETSVWLWVSKMRMIAAWITLPAFVGMFLANELLTSKYPGGILPAGISRPSSFVWLLCWRNWSLYLTALCGLISLPRWQSLLGLAGVIVFLYYFGRG